MPKTKLHRTVAKHKARCKTKNQKGASVATIHALNVTKIDWSRIDNPFILEPGVPLFE